MNPESLIHLNGHLVRREQASISLEDAGFQHAVGLFETMTARHGKVFQLQRHLDRLADSAAQLRMALTTDRQTLTHAIDETLEANGLTHARVRLTVTPGSVSLLRSGDASARPEPTVCVVATPPVEYAPEYFDKGVMAIVGPAMANPFDPHAGHKTLAYWSRLSVLRQAASVGAAEAIILQVSNHLASGCVSNLFLVKNNELFTPIARGEETRGGLPAPVLPGVTRSTAIELAKDASIPAHKQMLSINDLLEADEVFLTNASWQLLPVTKIENKTIAGGQVGPITRRLRTAMLALIDEQTRK
ncbi:MAG: hypothetical protein GC164_11590 [Phycisphaera sp.]|nr:hypothetical protein [Phycisphaera sp.]